jgi:GNAT superfamily N-acetyltransferase
MITVRDKEFDLRPADPKKDLDWAYGLFKQSLHDFVEELAGAWPETGAYEFFSEGFCHMPIKMLMHDGDPIGFFGIMEEEKRVTVQRMYLAPAWRGAGLGGWIIGETLKVAHRAQKPFETEVLVNNKPAMAFYEHMGFAIVGADDDGLVKLHVIRHRDTESYVLPRNISSQSAPVGDIFDR